MVVASSRLGLLRALMLHGMVGQTDGRWARYEVLVDLHRNALTNAKLSITPHLVPITKPARALTAP